MNIFRGDVYNFLRPPETLIKLYFALALRLAENHIFTENQSCYSFPGVREIHNRSIGSMLLDDKKIKISTIGFYL